MFEEIDNMAAVSASVSGWVLPAANEAWIRAEHSACDKGTNQTEHVKHCETGIKIRTSTKRGTKNQSTAPKRPAGRELVGLVHLEVVAERDQLLQVEVVRRVAPGVVEVPGTNEAEAPTPAPIVRASTPHKHGVRGESFT